MNYTYHGQQGELILEHAGDIVIERAGLWTGSCRYSLPRNRFDLLPTRYSKHPYCDFMGMEKVRVVFAAGLWKAHVEYAGVEKDVSDEFKEYDLAPGTGNEPLETHPDFEEFAGKPSEPNPENGAIFIDPDTGEISTDDDKGVFDRFVRSSPLWGIEDFITQSNTVYTVSWTNKDKPEEENIEIVESLPGPDAPTYGGDYNWLKMPIAYAKRGLAYSCTQRYIRSGAKGWNALIYPGNYA